MRRIDLDPLPRGHCVRKRRATDIAQCLDRLTGAQAPRDFTDLPLAVAIHQQVCLRIEQDRAPHLLGPVVEMRDPAQRGLDAPDHDGHRAVGLARALRIDDHRAIRSLSALPAGRIRIIAAHALFGGVAIDHGVHVAGGDTEEQPRRTECPERLGTVPVRLRDNAHAQALRLEYATDDRHAEARMIHVGIAGHDDDIALLPAERVHFGARGRQKRRGGGCGALRGRRGKVGA